MLCWTFLPAGTASGQAKGWTFVAGNSVNDVSPVYGTLGVASGANTPGSRSAAAHWTDKQGNFWLFGGSSVAASGTPVTLNDLWRYSPQSGQWTWIAGPTAPPCTSGALECYGSAGVYGSEGTAASANYPGARFAPASWTDAAGHLWLFGGYGLDEKKNVGDLNDLWMYDPATNQWTWESGSNTLVDITRILGYGELGVYGTMGTPAPGNTPGGRQNAATWTGTDGSLWLFGGVGEDVAGQQGSLNDLWRFQPSIDQWTWVGGDNLINVCVGTVGACGNAGVYASRGTPDPTNKPGGRSSPAAWTTSDGSLWMFGGDGYDASGEAIDLNDLWKFDPASRQWTWITGVSTVSCPINVFSGYNECIPQPSVPGTLGVPAAGNSPGGRTSSANWIDTTGRLWLFGGTGLDVIGQYYGVTNDVWVFDPATSLWAWMGGEALTGDCAWVYFGPPQVVYACAGQAGDPANPLVRQDPAFWTDTAGNFWMFGGQVPEPNGGYFLSSDLWTFRPYTATLPQLPAPLFSLVPGTYTSGGPLVMGDGMATAAIHYTTDGSTPTDQSSLYTAPLNLTSTSLVRAFASASGYNDSTITSASYTFAITPPPPVFSLAPAIYTSAQTVTISDAAPGVTIFYSTDGTTPNYTSSIYKGPISVSATETLNAIAEANGNSVVYGIADGNGYLDSTVDTATYTIQLPQAATPTFSVPAGSYTTAQTIAIADATAGATIYYTLDGSTPSVSSFVYTGAVTISRSSTLKAIAATASASASPVASATYNINLPAADFSMSASPTSITAASGQSAASRITISPLNGFNATVSFSCAGLPTGASCEFAPASLAVSGGDSSTQLTISGASTTATLRQPSSIWFAGSTLVLLSSLFRRNRRRRILWLLPSFAAVFLLNGCGSSTSSAPSPPQPVTYAVTVTASSGTQQHATTLQLTVD